MARTTAGPAVGLVGLGNLGQAIGLHLLAARRRVCVLDRSPERTAVLTEAGAREASPGELAECGVVAFAVPDERAIQEVLGGGLLEGLGPGRTVVVHSTVLPERTRELAALVTARGACYVDAPVTGGAERARRGKLAAFVGAEAPALAAVRPYLDTVAAEVHHLGPVGAGAAVKLANQLVMFAALGGVLDGIRLGAAYGVGEEALLGALSTGTADTWVGRNWGFFDRVACDYDAAGVPADDRPWRKDLREIVAAAGAAGTPAQLATLLADTVATPLEAHAAQGAEAAEPVGAAESEGAEQGEAGGR
ncbi:NAD(P)-dependent oxidoreductase [Streptomyces sp. NPDC050560]|uniref:NAD(P)-dependent oxidoreductase n=1 Tax=Streptomyces sp. NPDC050560 TaxID=3365630 RepID=UPI0037AA356E